MLQPVNDTHKMQLHAPSQALPPTPPFCELGDKPPIPASPNSKWGIQMIMERIALTLTDSITAKRYENPSVVFPTLKKGG